MLSPNLVFRGCNWLELSSVCWIWWHQGHICSSWMVSSSPPFWSVLGRVEAPASWESAGLMPVSEALSWSILLCQHPNWRPVSAQTWKADSQLIPSDPGWLTLFSFILTHALGQSPSRPFPVWFLHRNAGVHREFRLTSDDTTLIQCPSWGGGDAGQPCFLMYHQVGPEFAQQTH